MEGGGLEPKHRAEVALEAQAAGRCLEAWQPLRRALIPVSPPRRLPGTRLPGAVANRAAQCWQVHPVGSVQGQAYLCAAHVGLMPLSERPAVPGPRLAAARPAVYSLVHPQRHCRSSSPGSFRSEPGVARLHFTETGRAVRQGQPVSDNDVPAPVCGQQFTQI